MKAVKLILKVVLGIVAVVLIAVMTLPLWLGPVVKPLASSTVPTLTKTSFAMSHLSLNPYTGRFELGGLKLGNPAGYKQPVAVSLESLVVDVAMDTLDDEFVHVEEVTVKGLYASYLTGGEYGVDNFTQIQYNLAGGKEQYEAKKAEEEAAKANAKPEPMPEPEAEEDVAKKKFVIDRLTIDDVKVCLGPVTMPIPVTITLTDVGKKEKGVTLKELVVQVWEAILKQATQFGDGAKLLGTMLGDQAGKLGEAVKSVDMKGATDAVNSSAEKLGDAAKSVGEEAGKAVNSLKSLFK